MIPWMKTWFAAREQSLPGTVRWSEQFGIEELPGTSAASHRYNVAALDQMTVILNEP
jgi:hypothetical protein